jgi:CheY-like chemotaxis protein
VGTDGEETERNVVLVVDDEEVNRQLYRDALELDGYEVVVAPGGREAIEILQAREVHAIVCDIQMPHNGLRVFEYLVENFPHLRERFIFVTGSVEKKQQAERMTEAAAYLQKPFSLRRLRETISGLLGTESGGVLSTSSRVAT